MVLGIEIGGTKLQLGVGAGDTTELVDVVRLPVDRSAGAAGILNQIKEAGSKLVAANDVDRVGVGFGGPIDMSTGVVVRSMQVDGWDGFELANWCDRVFGLPVTVGNDCDVAALAEATLGAGKGHRIVLYVTVGTGVGGGLVIDGRLHADHRVARAEIGQLRPGLDAKTPDVTVESIAAGPGIERAVRKRLAEDADSAAARAFLEAAGIATADEVTAKAVAAAARAGDPIAAAAFESATRALGWAIAQVITLTAAEAVVIGGGVSLTGEALFFDPIRRHVAEYVFPPFANTYTILPAALGEEVVVHGAIVLAAGGGAG